MNRTKTLLVFTLVIAIIFLTNFDQHYKDLSLANARTVEGKLIFFYSAPYYDHDTVFQISTMAMTADTDKILRRVVKKAKKEAAKRNVEFDGIITGPRQYDYIIKFK
ncbi:MAG: hypothetical protein AAF600_20450 [Bacteroidota bacterium]